MQHFWLPLAIALLPSSTVAEGPFRDLSFEEALVAAAREEKVVFIDFFTTWCGPCKRLDQITWRDAAVVSWLEATTIPVKIDAEKQVALARRFGVGAYPTLQFVGADGQSRGGLVGYLEPLEFLRQAKGLLGGVKRSVHLRERLAEDPQDPNLRKNLALMLVQERSYEEAAELYLWCWDHGDEDPRYGFAGVRASSLRSEIARLVRVHPPLLAALVQRRDRARTAVLGASPDRRACVDFTLLGETIGDRRQTLETYDSLRTRVRGEEEAASFDPRPVLFESVVDLLLLARRYHDLVEGFGDPERWFERRRKEFERASALVEDAEGLRSLRLAVISDAAQLYEALVGTRQHDDAGRRFGLQVVAFEEGPKPWIVLMYAAGRAARGDVQEELRTAALAALPIAMHKRIPKVKPR